MTCGVRNVGTSSKPAAINSISPKDYDNRKPFELVSCEIVYLLFGTSVKGGQPPTIPRRESPSKRHRLRTRCFGIQVVTSHDKDGIVGNRRAPQTRHARNAD